MSTRLRRIAVLGAVMVVLSACGGGDEGRSGTGSQGKPGATSDADAPTATPTTTSSAAACSPEESAAVGDGFDRGSCVTLNGGLDNPTLVDDTVWGWVNGRIVAYDAATGQEVFRSEELQYGIDSMAVIEVDGEQLVAASVVVKDPGDAVKAPSEGWRLLAWPADAAKTGSAKPAIDVSVEVTEGQADPINSETFWGSRGVMINNNYLSYDATEFEKYKLPDDYKLQRNSQDAKTELFYVGTSQDVALAFVEEVQHVEADDEARNFAGFFAVDAAGEVLWDHIASTPERSLAPVSYGGPTHAKAVWGDYALDVTMAKSGDGDIKWYDAATGEEATPTPDELAGAPVRGFEEVKVTPDGRYLTFSAPEAGKSETLILDVAGNTLTPVDSENKLPVTSMIGTTMYATGADVTGAAVVDLTTGAATAMKSGTAPIAVSERFGVFNSGDTLVVAPTS